MSQALKDTFSLKHIQYVYTGMFLMCLVILVLIYRLLVCFRYSREKSAAVSRADVTGGTLLVYLQ